MKNKKNNEEARVISQKFSSDVNTMDFVQNRIAYTDY